MTRIARIEVLHYRHRLAWPIATVMGPMTHRPALMLRIEDGDGQAGWGEIWCNFPPGGDMHRAQLAAQMAEVFVDAGQGVEAPFMAMLNAVRRLIIQSGEPGPFSQVACAYDMALADLRARQLELPLAVSLGGELRPLPAYASGISPTEAPGQVTKMRGRGYCAFKHRIGFGHGEGIAQARETAESLGPGEALMVDANQAWDAEAVKALAQDLAALSPLWLEEPIPADMPASDWAALSADICIPLAAGENVTGRSGFKAMIESGALAFLQPDVCKWGGVSETYKIARAAEAAGVTYCPHFLGGGVGLLASAHLLSAVGGAGWLEVDSSENPLLEAICGSSMTLTDGMFSIPDAPGLGCEPDRGAIAAYLFSETEVRI